jgi:hypothetical protein
MQEAERIAAPKGNFRERKMPHRFGGYVALMRNISDVEPYSFEEEDKLQLWKDAMLEEYKSIIKNNVWDIVPRPKDKSMFSSKWIYKIKHVVGTRPKWKEGGSWEIKCAETEVTTRERTTRTHARKCAQAKRQLDKEHHTHGRKT